MSAHVKRTFLNRAFHPGGVHACEMSGMVSASPEVQHAEYVATQSALDSVPDGMVEWAIERASWVTDVINSEDWGGVLDISSPIGEGEAICSDCGNVCPVMTLQEMLVKFYLAMRLEEQDGQLVR